MRPLISLVKQHSHCILTQLKPDMGHGNSGHVQNLISPDNSVSKNLETSASIDFHVFTPVEGFSGSFVGSENSVRLLVAVYLFAALNHSPVLYQLLKWGRDFPEPVESELCTAERAPLWPAGNLQDTFYQHHTDVHVWFDFFFMPDYLFTLCCLVHSKLIFFASTVTQARLH